MKNKIFFVFFLLFLFPISVSSHRTSKHPLPENLSGKSPQDSPQSTKKPREDYMSSFLLRNAKPLGLKDNAVLRKFLNQPSIKWAMRSGGRHILN
jgi:hypothetical protein